MDNTLILEKETSETGSSKVPMYGAFLLALAFAALMLVNADTVFQTTLAAITLGLTATALILCARMRPTTVTIRVPSRTGS